MNINVSIIQFSPVLGNQDQNISIIKGMLGQVQGSDLIVLPELANAGYNFISSRQAFESAEDLHESKYLSFLSEEARNKKAFIVSGVCELDGGELYNTAILVGPQGLIGKYRKIHLFMNEKDLFRTGNAGLPVFDLPFGKIGMLICFDYLFPETWRIQAMKGADIICHPANLLTSNAHKVIPALALMNKIFILTANRIGTEGNLTFCGRSFVADPFGDITHISDDKSASVINATLDLTLPKNKMITLRNHVFNDRLPDKYLP